MNNPATPETASRRRPSKGKRGQVRIHVPRDRNSEFEPQPVKNQTRLR
ncbi:MAG TPA: hypothetical protein VGC66_06920 [Pyrinomonadaceae bacterium]